MKPSLFRSDISPTKPAVPIPVSLGISIIPACGVNLGTKLNKGATSSNFWITSGYKWVGTISPFAL